MRTWLLVISFCVGCALLTLSGTDARASLILVTGAGTTHTGNLVTNGSFETGAPPSGAANHPYWATGTSLTPFGVPPGWTSSGSPPAYAAWGNDATGPQSIRGSAAIPDGNAALYFGNGAPVLVSQPPTFNADGTVTVPRALRPYMGGQETIGAGQGS